MPSDFTYMWNLKTKLNKKKQKQAHRYRDQIIGYQKGWGSGGASKVGEGG